MKLIWTASSKIGSQIIRWGLDSDCSHFAISFDEGDGDEGIVFHSHGKGTQLEWLTTFIGKNQIVHVLEPVKAMTLEQEEFVYKRILRSEANRGYDYAALAWFAWRAVVAKISDSKIGGVNRWQRSNARLCTGIIPAVIEALGGEKIHGDIELVKPHDLVAILLETGLLKFATGWPMKVFR